MEQSFGERFPVDLPVFHHQTHGLNATRFAIRGIEELGIATDHGDVFKRVAVHQENTAKRAKTMQLHFLLQVGGSGSCETACRERRPRMKESTPSSRIANDKGLTKTWETKPKATAQTNKRMPP